LADGNFPELCVYVMCNNGVFMDSESLCGVVKVDVNCYDDNVYYVTFM